MPLIQCPDCGKKVSNAAPACPHCGRPLAIQQQFAKKKDRKCRHCGSDQVGKVRGLQGFKEIIIFLILFLCGIIPGIIYYIWIESVPYCLGCGKRI